MCSHRATPLKTLRRRAKMGMQPILPITVTIKKIKGAGHKCNDDGDMVARWERALRPGFACAQQFPADDIISGNIRPYTTIFPQIMAYHSL